MATTDENIAKVSQDLAALKASTEPCLSRFERAIQDITNAGRQAEIAASTLALRVSTLEAAQAGYKKFGFWALCLVVAAVASPVIKFALSGGIYAIPNP